MVLNSSNESIVFQRVIETNENFTFDNVNSTNSVISNSNSNSNGNSNFNKCCCVICQSSCLSPFAASCGHICCLECWQVFYFNNRN